MPKTLHIPHEKSTKQDWIKYARWLEQERSKTLDEWGKTVDELDLAFKALREANTEQRTTMQLLASSNSSLQIALNLLETSNEKLKEKEQKRKRGRPKKSTDDLRILELFEEMAREFAEENPGVERTDTKVLNWYFERMFVAQGMRASRVRTKEFQGKLKTFRNHLSEGRDLRERAARKVKS